MDTIVELDDGTSPIDITLITPTRKDIPPKASRVRIDFSSVPFDRSRHIDEEHGLAADGDYFGSKGEIQADFPRRLQRESDAEALELSVKRHSGIIRLVRKLSLVARNRSLSRQ
jgi:hypothetical protein